MKMGNATVTLSLAEFDYLRDTIKDHGAFTARLCRALEGTYDTTADDQEI